MVLGCSWQGQHPLSSSSSQLSIPKPSTSPASLRLRPSPQPIPSQVCTACARGSRMSVAALLGFADLHIQSLNPQASPQVGCTLSYCISFASGVTVTGALLILNELKRLVFQQKNKLKLRKKKKDTGKNYWQSFHIHRVLNIPFQKLEN